MPEEDRSIGEYKKEEAERRALIVRIAELSRKLEKYNLADYMNYLYNPRRYIVFNFLGGLFRGLGMALGFTILGALVLLILQRLVVLNLPVIGDFIAELVRIVLQYL